LAWCRDVCVYGAGAIGGHVAGRLAKGGADVSVVARGAHLAATRQHGQTVVDEDGRFTVPVADSETPSALGRQDAVIVTVKAPALPSVAAGIGPLLGPDTPVALVMNGTPWCYFHGHGGPLDGQRLPKLDPRWGPLGRRPSGKRDRRRGLLGLHRHSTRRQRGRRPATRIVLGEPDGRITARVEGIAAALRAGGWGIEATDRLRDAVWTALVLNP